MRILVTGGNGSIGRGLVPVLLARGHHVTVLDKDSSSLPGAPHANLRYLVGVVEDPAAVREASHGAEAIIHLAWSFADDPKTLLDVDLRGHLLLLEAARAEPVRHFIYTSTAVVYGKPLHAPMDEEHPLRVLEARKPAYGMAKEFAEKLTLLAAKERALSATILRFWWAFAEEIGGRHLREMLRAAAEGKPVAVPADCGGSFLSQEDFNRAVEASLNHPSSTGRVFNLASAYITWEEVARIVAEVTESAAGIQVVPQAAWAGAAFLADRWELDDGRIRTQVGFRPARDPGGVLEALRGAIAATWRQMRSRAS